MLDFLQHLRETGLVCQRKRTAGFFFPTPLALSLAIGKSGDSSVLSSGLMKSKGFLVVETNFRVYTYSDSALQLAVVSTFCDMTYRFGNMSVGVLTRESVRRALSVGITANQIIDYLRTNAHDQMLKEAPIVPPTITDQIRLWELERDRFIFDEGVLYSNFISDDEYSSLRNYARQIDALMWESAGGRMLVVTPSGHELIKQWKNQNQNQNQKGPSGK